MAVFVLVRRAPASCLGLYSQNVNTLRPTLGSFCFGQASACIVPWILLTECEHFETNTWQFFVLVRRAPPSSPGFHSRNVNTLRQTLGSFCFGQAIAGIAPWILLTECEHFETNTWQLFFVLVRRAPASCLGFYSQNVNTMRPTLRSFCFGQASACIVPWFPLTECEHSETNTWQFLFWLGERLHRALDSTHRM